ncbi:MAG: hypothetical protein V2B20_08055 [Pseudomonadota bacterium]
MKLSSQDVFQISKSFRELSVSLGDYRFANWSQLSDKQKRALEDAEWSLLNASADIRTAAVGVVLEETELSFEKLQQTTSEAKMTIECLEDIRKVIKMSSAAVSLAGAIISRDPSAICKTAKDLYKVITTK